MAEYVAAAAVVVALVSAGVGTYMSVEAQENQAKAAKAEGDFREQEAEGARAAAAYEEKQTRRRLGLLMGRQSAAQAAAGVDVSSGSPLLLELDTARQVEMEALNVRAQGANATNSKLFEARIARQRASFASGQTPWLIAGGTAQAGSSVLGTWSNYNRGYYGTKSA